MVKMDTQKPKPLSDWELEEFLRNEDVAMWCEYTSGAITLEEIRRISGIKRRE